MDIVLSVETLAAIKAAVEPKWARDVRERIKLAQAAHEEAVRHLAAAVRFIEQAEQK